MNLLPEVLRRGRRAMSTTLPATGFWRFSQCNDRSSGSQRAHFSHDGFHFLLTAGTRKRRASDQSP
jgi:hypothetical protein